MLNMCNGIRSCVCVAILGAVVCVAQASPIVTNPSFETGDLTGWDAFTPKNMNVVEGSASDGTHYLTADIQWTHTTDWMNVGNTVVPVDAWTWEASCYQRISVASVVGQFSVDIRTSAVPAGCVWSVALFSEGNPIYLFSMPSIVLPGEPDPVVMTSAPNGFTRYTGTFPDASAYEWIDIQITASGHVFEMPAFVAEFSVDNIQITPEPSTMLVLAIGAAILRRNRRTARLRA
jgi:hypothetical protein